MKVPVSKYAQPEATYGRAAKTKTKGEKTTTMYRKLKLEQHKKHLTNGIGKGALRFCSTCDIHHAVRFNNRLKFTHGDTL